MEALLSGDGPDHSTAWRGPGRGGTDGRLTDSLSGSSIYSASVHAFRLGPQGCGPPKGAKQITRTAGILDGRVSRGLSYPHLPPTSVHPSSRVHLICPLTQKLWRFKSPIQILLALLPPLLPISRLLQQSVHLSLPHPKICARSSRASVLPNPLQRCCAVAETYSCRLAHWFSC